MFVYAGVGEGEVRNDIVALGADKNVGDPVIPGIGYLGGFVGWGKPPGSDE